MIIEQLSQSAEGLLKRVAKTPAPLGIALDEHLAPSAPEVIELEEKGFIRTVTRPAGSTRYLVLTGAGVRATTLSRRRHPSARRFA